MDGTDMVGVLAHPGGLLVDRPELTVGVVRAVSLPAGLELELLARRPLDRRDPVTRQADIRAGRDAVHPAPRRFLPAYDEGGDLRIGWLDDDLRAHWAFGDTETGSGDPADGVWGPYVWSTVRLPATYDRLSLILAWPEIGFCETVVTLPMPDRATVERDSMSIWAAPLPPAVPETPPTGPSDGWPDEVAVETGRVITGPLVLARNATAVVVLNRLTGVGPMLSFELLGVARSQVHDRRSGPHSDNGAAVVRAGLAHPLNCVGAMFVHGDDGTRGIRRFALARPPGDVLDLVVGWPQAGLPNVRVRLPL